MAEAGVGGWVRLVGIGPGHPALLTRQAAEAIREADVVRHPPGCEPGVLRLARPKADVGPYRDSSEVVRLAHAGSMVAVLFPGDPYAFGGGAALAEVLARRGVPFDAVPGLIIEFAAPELSGVPLTVEGKGATIQLGVGAHADTVVVRFARGWWDSGVRALIDAGQPPSRPAVLIVEPGGVSQRRVEAPLAEVAKVAAGRGLAGEAVLVLGPGVELGGLLDTLSRRRLHGCRVLVTRAAHQVEQLRRQLSDQGADVIEIPTIEVRPADLGDEGRSVVEHLDEVRMIVFPSPNAVEGFFQLLAAHDRDARALHRARICAIGAETVRALELKGIRPELEVGEYTAEDLVEALAGWDLGGAWVLVPRARQTRDALPALLRQRAARVDVLGVYEAALPASARPALRELFAGRGVDVVTFTSSACVANFVRCFPAGALPEVLGGARVACMGPVTADTARKLGLPVSIIAREYNPRGLTQAILDGLG